MNKRLDKAAKVIDEKNVDFEEDFSAQEMYSSGDNGVDELYSSEKSDTCGVCNFNDSLWFLS